MKRYSIDLGHDGEIDEAVNGEWVRFDDVQTQIERLRAALMISRGQWIHSVNAEQCMLALGLEAEWREIVARRMGPPGPADQWTAAEIARHTAPQPRPLVIPTIPSKS